MNAIANGHEINSFRPARTNEDLVRFSAALTVFIVHLKVYAKGTFGPFWGFHLDYASQTAVTVFFVLSGYVIAHVLATREGTPLDRTRFVLQPLEPLIAKAVTPPADDPRLYANLLAMERVLRPSAAKRTIRARFRSRWIVCADRQSSQPD